MLDNFYGLKDAHQIESFAQLFHDLGMESALKDKDTKVADAAVYRLITDFISDGHTKWHAFSYLAGPNEITAKDATRAKVLIRTHPSILLMPEQNILGNTTA